MLHYVYTTFVFNCVELKYPESNDVPSPPKRRFFTFALQRRSYYCVLHYSIQKFFFLNIKNNCYSIFYIYQYKAHTKSRGLFRERYPATNIFFEPALRLKARVFNESFQSQLLH